MKISVLTLVTKPDERQDLWREALANYCEFADEVVVVDGTIDGPLLQYPDPKVKFVGMGWPDEWTYDEFPKHLNFGKKYCTGDFIVLLFIDQLIHQKEHNKLRSYLETANPNIDLFKLIKLNFVANMHYHPRGTHGIVFRNRPHIGFGFMKDFPDGDMCIPMDVHQWVTERGVPEGVSLKTDKTDCFFWNFNCTFRTLDVQKAHFFRNARAHKAFFKDSKFGGNSEDESWEFFLNMMRKKYALSDHVATLEELPAQMREPIKNLRPEQLGFNLWGE